MDRERSLRFMRRIGPPALAIGIIGLTLTSVQEDMTHNHEFNRALSAADLSTEDYSKAQAKVSDIRQELDEALINGSTSKGVTAILMNPGNLKSIDTASRGKEIRDQIYKPDKWNSIRSLVRGLSQMLMSVGLPFTIYSFLLRQNSSKSEKA